MTDPRTTALRGVRVIAVEEEGLPDSNSSVIISAGRIADVTTQLPTVDRVIEGRGRFALPGLVNAHDHLYSKELRNPDPGMDIRAMRREIDGRDVPETLVVMLANAWREMAEGVLVIRDLGARHALNTHLARIIDGGVVPGPVVVPAARPIVMTGGHVWTFGREADGPDDCRRAVREQKKAGAQVIKVMASGGVSNYPHEDYAVSEFTPPELEAITSEARKLGLPTCAHAYGEEAVSAAVDARIDGIEHGVRLDDGIIEKMVANQIAYVPTMANMQRIASVEMNAAAGVPERAAVFQREIVEPHMRSVTAALEAGVRVGIGTDSTGSYLEEIRALTRAGMGVEQVIRAATIEGARICRVDAGLIAPGRLALMALYDEDPRRDVEVLVRPSAVLIGGRFFESERLEGWAAR
ncbi:MAG: amidohydrolase family protein [Acidimicrobiia bacterium]|nr:amidohydrolase family protein [Acidimicrobiia bacterium]